MVRLSVLDQSPISEGSTASTALRNTVDLAQLCDQLGYTRYWLAEHHATPMLAGASPEALIQATRSPAAQGPAARSRAGLIPVGLGPVGLSLVGAPVTAAMVVFSRGAEVAIGRYGAGDAQVVLISYPTPQIAGERADEEVVVLGAGDAVAGGAGGGGNGCGSL